MYKRPGFIEPLTTREQKILSLIDQGLSYTEIGQDLCIEKATVTWYVQEIYDKLGLEKSQRSHRKAIALALSLGILAGSPAPTSPEGPLKNPYKGLHAFQQADAHEFYGREAFVQQLLSRLKEEGSMARFLALVGPSGCGKSSVLHAGLIAALKQGRVEGSASWIITSMLPGSHPLDELEAALIRVATKPGIQVMEQLRRDERGLQRVVGMLLPERSDLLLVVDQFEEIFSPVADEDERNRFLELIGNSVTQTHSRVRVVAALRADYFDRPLMAPAISALFRQRTEAVAPLTRDELVQAICLPARQTGVTVEPDLEAALVAEVSQRPGLLPLMQYTLTELFDRRQDRKMTLAAYHQIGGVRGALTRRADLLYESLSEPQQVCVRQIFQRLVRPGLDSEGLRQRVPLAELHGIGTDPQMVGDVINEMAHHRLLTLDYDTVSGSAMVEVAHEALMREWERLRAWLDESRADMYQQRLLAAAASDWRAARYDPSYLLSGTRLLQLQSWAQTTETRPGPDEQEFLAASQQEKQCHERRQRAARNLVLGVSFVVTAIMVVLTLIIFDHQQKAELEAAISHSLWLANMAREEMSSNSSERALLLAMEAVAMDAPPELSEQIFRTILREPGARAVLTGHAYPVTAVAINHDGTYAISGSCGQMTPDLICIEGQIILWNIGGDALEAGELQRFGSRESDGHSDEITSVVFKPSAGQGERLTALSTSKDGQIILWNALQGEAIRKYLGNAGAANQAAFSPDGRQFISAHAGGVVILWDTATGAELRRLDGQAGPVRSVAFAPDGKTAFSASAPGVSGAGETMEGALILWDLTSGAELRRYPCPAGVSVLKIVLGPKETNTVWGISSDYAIRYWNIESTEGAIGIPAARDPYPDFALMPDGTTAVLPLEGVIYLRSISNLLHERSLLQTSQAAYTFVYSIAVSPDGSYLVSGDGEGKVELWNLSRRDDLRFIPVEGVSSLSNAILHPDGRRVLFSSGSQDAQNPSLFFMDLATRRFTSNFPQLPKPPMANSVAMDASGRRILAGGGNAYTVPRGSPAAPFLWILDAESGAILHLLKGHRYTVKAVAISPDGRYGLSGSTAWVLGKEYESLGELILWDMETGELLRVFENSESVGGVAFSPDGAHAVSVSQMAASANITVWDIATGQSLHRFPGINALDVIYSPGGASILTNAMTNTSRNKVVEMDTSNGKFLRSFTGLDGPSFNVDMSPDNRYLFAASVNYGVLWDTETGQEVNRFDLPLPLVTTWAVFPPGRESALIIQDNTRQLIEIQIHQVPTLEELRAWITQNRYLRDWTCEEREMFRIEPLCP